ncbi:unnamed protein product [Linum trigynum]|uniref:RING-type domain-containing protein n=2 Tax=Linum trigynum TaxID=586398 RepID=A0AAV2D9M2_9ROSI
MSTSTYECQPQYNFALLMDRFTHILLWSPVVVILAIVLFLYWIEHREREPLGDVEQGFHGYRVEIFKKTQRDQGDERRSSEECAICLEEFEDGDERSLLTACCHVYHTSCLQRWLAEAYKRSCPLCRAHIVTHDRAYGESSDEIINNHLEHQLR